VLHPPYRAPTMLPCRFYKGLRWFEKDAEPVVLVPGHNQHHRYTNPVIFDAFSGSLYAPCCQCANVCVTHDAATTLPSLFSSSLHHIPYLLLGQHPYSPLPSPLPPPPPPNFPL